MRKAALLWLMLLTGCVRMYPPSAQTGAEASFGRLADDFIAGYLAWRPQTGTALGLHEFDGKVTDYSRASIEGELTRLKDYERRLGKCDARCLGPVASRDLRILQGAIRREIFGIEEMRIYFQNPMTYAGAYDVSIYVKRDFAPLEARARSLAAILREVPKGLANARTNLDDALPKPQVETAIEMAEGAVEFLSRDLVDGLKDLKNESVRADFTDANQQAVAAMRAYALWLEQEKLPRAHDRYALGAARYATLLRCSEGIVIPPDQILALGLRELKREQQRFADAAAQIDPSRKPIEVFRAIQKEHPTEASLIPDTKKNLEAIRQFLIDHEIISLPGETRARVDETPQFLRATSFASMDTPGPFETKATEAYYYVTPVEKEWPAARKEEWLTAFNYFTTDVVSIHEAYPGHYIQFLCLNASSATRIEKIFNSYAFIEGWAHYTEQMMIEQGFGAGSLAAVKYRLAQSDEALLRLCRLCVSVQMHCHGMSVEAATRFFQENCYYEEKPAKQEATRGAFDPEYLYYSLGKLAMLKLREDYRQQEGQAFSLRQFHDEVLRHGAPPLRLLREAVLKNPKTHGEVF